MFKAGNRQSTGENTGSTEIIVVICRFKMMKRSNFTDFFGRGPYLVNRASRVLNCFGEEEENKHLFG